MAYERLDERTRDSWELVERALAIAGGAALLLYGLRRDSGAARLLGVIAAGAVLYEGLSGRRSLLRLMGGSPNAAEGRFDNNVLQVTKSFQIRRPAQELYEFWRHLENLPRFMRHLESVEQIDHRRSRWTAKGPLGTQVHWESEITRDVPGEEIAWQSLPGEGVENRGVVRFKPVPSGGTELQVAMQYRPPAGRLGSSLAKLFGEEPQIQVEDDLRRFKNLIESGEAGRSSHRT
jgi:uncharacterized membrane protein